MRGGLLTISILQGVAGLLVVVGVYGLALHLGRAEAAARAMALLTLMGVNLGLIFTNRSWSRTIFGSPLRDATPWIVTAVELRVERRFARPRRRAARPPAGHARQPRAARDRGDRPDRARSRRSSEPRGFGGRSRVDLRRARVDVLDLPSSARRRSVAHVAALTCGAVAPPGDRRYRGVTNAAAAARAPTSP